MIFISNRCEGITEMKAAKNNLMNCNNSNIIRVVSYVCMCFKGSNCKELISAQQQQQQQKETQSIYN